MLHMLHIAVNPYEEANMVSNQSKAQQRQGQGALVTDGLGTALFEGIFYGIGLLGTAMVGAWALSCLIAGMIAAGGPVKLAMSWFQAVTGM